jgi:hypothetical protein
MKKYIQKIELLISLAVIAGLINISCKQEEKPNGGTPKIDYVRLTDPAVADSFITSAYMGQIIAIVGENLGGAREIMFNDQPGFLTPTYVTDKTIIVTVPNTVPTVVNDKMTLTFADGYELEYDFNVAVPPPNIISTKCEYIPDGGTMLIEGDYFFEPLTVLFPDSLEAEVISVEKTKLEVTVPVGATPGQIKVKNVFGTGLSPFLFRDNRNTIIDFDVKMWESWTGAIAYADSAPEVPATSRNYGIIQSTEVTDWDWENNLAIMAWGEGVRGDVPLATGLVSDLDFRFEVNVPIGWYDVRMEIYFAPYGAGHGRDVTNGGYITSFCRWRPWLAGTYTTEGWVTISIPLSEFSYGHDDPVSATPEQGTKPLQDLTGLTNVTMMVFGPREIDPSNGHPVKICVDNVRIVPNTVEE